MADRVPEEAALDKNGRVPPEVVRDCERWAQGVLAQMDASPVPEAAREALLAALDAVPREEYQQRRIAARNAWEEADLERNRADTAEDERDRERARAHDLALRVEELEAERDEAQGIQRSLNDVVGRCRDCDDVELSKEGEPRCGLCANLEDGAKRQLLARADKAEQDAERARQDRAQMLTRVWFRPPNDWTDDPGETWQEFAADVDMTRMAEREARERAEERADKAEAALQEIVSRTSLMDPDDLREIAREALEGS